MRLANILDIYEIHQHLKKYLHQDRLLLFVRELINQPRFLVYWKKGMLIVLEVVPDRERTVLLHAYIDEDHRGKEFIRALATLEGMVKEDISTVLFKTPKGAKHIQRIIMTNPKVIKIDEDNYEYVIHQSSMTGLNEEEN